MILVPHGAAAGGNAGQAANAAMACADCAGRILRCRVDSSRGNLSGPAPAASRRGAVGGSWGRLLARARAGKPRRRWNSYFLAPLI